MAVILKGDNLKFVVNLNADGNIAMNGETAAGTKTLSFLSVDADARINAVIEESDTDMFVEPFEVVETLAQQLLKTTYLPLLTNYNINVSDDGETLARLKAKKEAKLNGNDES